MGSGEPQHEADDVRDDESDGGGHGEGDGGSGRERAGMGVARAGAERSGSKLRSRSDCADSNWKRCEFATGFANLRLCVRCHDCST